MEQFEIYVLLFGLIVIIGQIFHRSTIPVSLLLVIAGMLISFIPGFPLISLNSNLVLNIFLPLLIYQISAYSSWKEVKKNFRAIALLSVGHVIFIAGLVAIVIHTLLPQLGWPLAFVLGAVISPPDDVAIVSIAEKIRMPSKIITILEGEGMFNDATALILFRLALAALVTHEFYIAHAVSSFFAIIIGETLYGFAVGYVMGQLRLKIHNPQLHLIASFVTPFIAYIPAVELGGCGVLATCIVGFIIGNYYAPLFSPEFRLGARTVWPALSYTIQNIVFLFVGLDLRYILYQISSISSYSLFLYSGAVILTVIIGRFIWTFPAAYLPRFLFPSIRKKDPYPPWQYAFIISWSGMRGGVSLAAAFAVPVLPNLVEGANPKSLLIFLVFAVIAATFLAQGLTLPWLLKKLGVNKFGQREQFKEHIAELSARYKITTAALHWLKEYKEEVKDDPKLLEEAKLYIREYRMLKQQLKERIASHDKKTMAHDEAEEAKEEAFLVTQVIEIEKAELLRLWHEDKITLVLRNRLLDRLDHRWKNITD